MKRKFLSLALALTLCLGLSISISAAENSLYLRYRADTNSSYSVEKTADGTDSALCLAGNVSITGVVANNTEGQSTGQPKFLPYCVASGPVTLTLMRDSEAIAEARIDAVQTSGSGYLVLEEHPVRFEEKTATISAPGKYHVEVRTAEFSQGAQAIIEIIESSASSAGFIDVAADSPFKAAIDWAVGQKITNGKTAATFGPGDTCTVSHILTFLYRAENGSGTENERAAVTAWASSLGIDTSNLSVPCTRAMAVNFMWKAAGSPALSRASAFADVPTSSEYAQAVSWAVEKGVTNGTGEGKFSPDNTCTRGQIVTFLYRASK